MINYKWILSIFLFSCTSRYVGEFCEFTNPCLTAPRCQNGGTCKAVIRDGQSTFECACPLGYSASLCEISEVTACSSSPCQNRGECVLKSLDTFECRCHEGFTGLLNFFYQNSFYSFSYQEKRFWAYEHEQTCWNYYVVTSWLFFVFFVGSIMMGNILENLLLIFLAVW